MFADGTQSMRMQAGEQDIGGKNMDEIRVKSWNDLNERLFAGAWQEPLSRFRSPYAFRGMSDVRHGLTSSLIRLGLSYEKQEGHMLRNFRKYARCPDLPGDVIWNWLALAQHHGLPTRLLDWTYSPFVALHFATENLQHSGADGVVWRIDFCGANALLPDKLKGVLNTEGADVFTAEMLNQAAPTLGEFDALHDAPFLAFFEPPSLDERIVNQFSLFSLMSSPQANLGDWTAAHSEFCGRIVIPAELKGEIRDKLDQVNITERVMFPGLDGLTRWLKRYYTPSSALLSGSSEKGGDREREKEGRDEAN